MKKLVLFTFAFLFSSYSFSQNSWSLKQCIDYAFENNISIKQADIAKLIASNNYLQSKLNLLPNISGDASLNFYFGNSINPTTYEFTQNATTSNAFNLSSNMPLFTGLQQYNNIKQQEFNNKASEEDSKNTRNTIALSIAQFYLQILQNKELLLVAKTQLEQSKQQQTKTEAQIASGTVPAGNRYQVEAQIANDELRIVNAQNAVDISLLSLKLLLQLNPETSFDIQTPNLNDEFLFDESVTPARIFDYATANQASIKSAEYRLLSTKKALLISKGAFSPTLSAYASIGTNFFNQQKTYTSTGEFNLNPIGFTENTLEKVIQPSPVIKATNTPYGEQLNQNLSERVGLSLSVPIFNKWNRVTNMNNAKLQVYNSSLALESAKNQLRQDIYQAYANMQSAKKSYEASQKNVLSLEKTLEFSKERFNVGALSQFDLGVIQNNLATAKSDLSRSKYDYLFKIKILEFYQGKTLELN
jgi:outer membrane protein